MTLLASFFTEGDMLLFPLAVLFFYYIIRNRANQYRDPKIKRLYYRAYYFKVFCVVLYTLITEFYFKGGDTALYYQATKDLRTAIADDPGNIWTALLTEKLSPDHPLFTYFYYDNYADDITANYMISAQNYFAPKLALLPSYLFGNSYICINMCFGFFALGGALRLFKTFYYFYPDRYKGLALACIFLPGVAFWSSGLLKDPITFGCIGYILYAAVNIFFKKKKYFASIMWILFCGFLMYYIKIYILLVLLLSMAIWLFAEFNKLIKDRTLRNVFTAMSFIVGALIGYALLTYVTSLEAAQEYQLDKLASNAERERQGYAQVAEKFQGDSHFEINASNPIMLVVGGVSATFFRPFLWEINSFIALFSAIESLLLLFLTAYFMFKRGVGKFFTVPFSDAKILMCFVFAIVFAIAVGSATANFGALSRYKIPCMPFYMIVLILIYRKTNLPYPPWFNKILNFVVPSAT